MTDATPALLAPVRCDFSTEGEGFDIPVRTFYFMVGVPADEAGRQRLAAFVNDRLHGEVLEAIEKEFGDHDVLGEDGELAGFSSYLVVDAQMKRAMRQWARAFSTEGFGVSPLQETTPDAYAADVLNAQTPETTVLINALSNGLPEEAPDAGNGTAPATTETGRRARTP